MHLDSPQYVGRLNIIKHFNLKQTNFKQTTFNLKKTILNKQPRKQTDRQTKSKQYMEGHMYSIKRFLSIPSHLSISIWNKDKVYQLPVIQPVQCNGQAAIFWQDCKKFSFFYHRFYNNIEQSRTKQGAGGKNYGSVTNSLFVCLLWMFVSYGSFFTFKKSHFFSLIPMPQLLLWSVCICVKWSPSTHHPTSPLEWWAGLKGRGAPQSSPGRHCQSNLEQHKLAIWIWGTGLVYLFPFRLCLLSKFRRCFKTRKLAQNRIGFQLYIRKLVQKVQ